MSARGRKLTASGSTLGELAEVWLSLRALVGRSTSDSSILIVAHAISTNSDLVVKVIALG
ncbi:hypothetical protein RBSH_04265 [Rhodopirellula baltica SH28]|uniref:Uncharacterized protein n=1 Tax=Rhodopirellula baltica SH28 TaxID=993517 RepID=K5DDL0_RHOBT|nr:hypothetical protein RBSH_04265 [Rhodopirellula baltica SH28]